MTHKHIKRGCDFVAASQTVEKVGLSQAELLKIHITLIINILG